MSKRATRASSDDETAPSTASTPADRDVADDEPVNLVEEFKRGMDFGNSMKERFTTARIDDRGLPIADALVCVRRRCSWRRWCWRWASAAVVAGAGAVGAQVEVAAVLVRRRTEQAGGVLDPGRARGEGVRVRGTTGPWRRP